MSESQQLWAEGAAWLMQMTKGNVGSLLVFDPSKFTFEGSEDNLKVASKEAVAGLVTERGGLLHMGASTQRILT